MKQFLVFSTILVFCTGSLYAQSVDSVIIQNDSSHAHLIVDSVGSDSVKKVGFVSQRPAIELKNKLLNVDSDPVSLAVQFKKTKSKDTIFYVIAGMILLMAFFKYFYNRYFTNLFRVFFNTSLRQSQLTDQLLQAKLPSLLFNIFFIISAGLYIYILLQHYQFIDEDNKWAMIFSSIGVVGLIYSGKYCTLKFTGWITGLKEVTDTYVFIVFLINKIIGVFLVPFIVILSFSEPAVGEVATIISLMSVGVFLLLRFFRSYGLLQNQLKISRFHFLLYITGIEVLPLLLIYRGLMIYLSKNL